jgi:aldose sugar dehydrogenase
LRRITACFLLSVLAIGSLNAFGSAPAALPGGAKVQTYKGELNFAIHMAWVPGTKRIFFTQKNGAIRVIIDRTLYATPCRVLDVDDSGEGGALGIALHPKFKENHYLYVYWTKRAPKENRVTRFTVKNNRCTDPKTIVKGIRADGLYHHGGQIEFMNGKLFISVGEAHDPGEAQKKNNRLGKILRVWPSGRVPDGNPFGANNPVWSYGHRNPFGLAYSPATGRLYSTENGPSCDDELNVISRGRNYGWGDSYLCGTAGVGTNPKPPIRRWSQPPVVTDPSWYEGTYGALSGSLYMGTYETGALYRFDLNADGTVITSESVIHTDGEGIVDVAKGPGGWLYYVTPLAIKRIVKS